jgi:hypothetical protein
MNRFQLIPIVLFGILFACQPAKDKTVPVLKLEDLVGDTLYLEKDTLTREIGKDFTYYKTDSGEVLAAFLTHQLLVFSYPEGKLLKKQRFEKEGPDGIGAFVTGSYLDDNTIYFLSQQKELIETDFLGKVLNRWALPEVEAGRKYVNYSSMPYNKLQKSGNDLYFVDLPFVFVDGFEKYDKWGMIFNTESKTFSNYSFLYPNQIIDYKDDSELGLFSHVYNPISKEHLIGFAISDSLAVVENGNQTWKWAGTSESLDFKRGTTAPSGEYIVFQPNHESSKYEGLDLDTYSGKILRWVRVKGPTNDNPEQERNRLLIFDSDLNREAELECNFKEIGRYGFNTPRGYALSLFGETTDDLAAFVVIDFSKINNRED